MLKYPVAISAARRKIKGIKKPSGFPEG